MGTERKRYQISVNSNTYEFQGAKYVYDAIKSKIGASVVTQRRSSATGALGRERPIKAVEELRQAIPRLRITMKPDGLGNTAQADQGRRTRTMDVYVDPGKYESALRVLPNTRLGTVAGFGGWVIDSVSLPRRRRYY